MRSVLSLASSTGKDRNLRRLCSSILLLVGGSLLLASLSAYAWMALAQRHLTAGSLTASSGPGAAPDPNSSVTLLIIPKISLQAAILDGTGRLPLLLAPGHLEDTPWPGDPGNSVLAAHRDTFFRRLHELEPGDGIVVRRGSREYRYRVTRKSIVPPHDLSSTYPTSDTRLSLITCYPTEFLGRAPQRLVVIAELEMPVKTSTQ